MKRYKAQIDRNKQENTLKLTFDRIPVENVVDMYQAWPKYASEREGTIDAMSWSGMPNNPVEVWKTYKFKCLDMKISSKRDKFEDDLQTVELFFSGKNKLDGIVRGVIDIFFSKYLVPREYVSYKGNVWKDKLPWK